MRLISLLFVFLIVHPALALSGGGDKEVAKKMKPLFKAMTSTNNVNVFLNSKTNKLSYQAKSQLLKIAKRSKSPMYQSRIISGNSFALKLANSKWATFKLNYKNNSMMVGKSSFKWNFKKNIKLNIAKISKLIEKEYGSRKKAATLLGLIPYAYADANDDLQATIAATVTINNGFLSSDIFLGDVNNFCERGQINPFRGSPFAEDRERVRARFFAAREELKEGWRIFTMSGQYQKFYSAQSCLRNEGFISREDAWVHSSDSSERNGAGSSQ